MVSLGRPRRQLPAPSSAFIPFVAVSVGRLHHPGAEELLTDPGQGGGRAAGGGDSPIRVVPSETAGGPEGARRDLVEKLQRT